MTYTEAIVILCAELELMLKKDGAEFNRAYIGGKVGRIKKGYYWHPLTQIDRGFQGRKYNVQDDDSGHREHQIIEQPIQLTIYSENPQTHADSVFNMAENARMLVQSLPFIERLKSKGIEVTRPENLRTLQIINDSDNYEDEVSFQFSIIYTRSISLDTPAVKTKTIETTQI